MAAPTRAELLAQVEALQKRVRALERKLSRAERDAGACRAELAESREQQAAAAEILRVISSSPSDLQPVFDTIVESAVRLCHGGGGGAFRYDGTLLHVAAIRAARTEGVDFLRSRYPQPLDGATGPVAHAIRSGEIVNIADVTTHATAAAGTREIARRFGYRSQLVVPMTRDGVPIGAISVARPEVGAFDDGHVALLRTFADQAVIAIENVRLFKELEARNRELTEALEQQTATSEILRVISSSPTELQPVFEAVVESAARLCDATDASIHRAEGDVMRHVASHGLVTTLRLGETSPITLGSLSGRAIIARETVHVHDSLAVAETEFPDRRLAIERQGIRTALGVPLLCGGIPLGAIIVRRTEVRPFSEKQIKLLETFADQAVIAIENVRLFTELQEKNRDLTEALEQQTATAEILRVISRSQTNIQPVFDTILRSAVTLCNARFGVAYRYDGELIHVMAHHNFTPEALQVLKGNFPARPSAGTVTARAIADHAVVQIEDGSDPALSPPGSVTVARELGYRAMISVPMLREGNPIGTMTLARAERGVFSEANVAMLQTFADQAVIAVENVRLFTELEVRNRDLTDALERQTATAELLRVISRSQTDPQPVFDTIADSAMRLLRPWSVVVCRFDGELIHLAAVRGGPHEPGRSVLDHFPTRPTTGLTVGRCIIECSVIQIGDVETEAGPVAATREMARTRGWRSALAVPMLRDGLPIGAIMVTRAEAGGFGASGVELLQTFADQAVIAVENVRLFTELQAKNRDLTTALAQQGATGDILSVISSSPTDVQPVFDAIVRSATVLCEGLFACVFLFDGSTVRLAAHHNLRPDGLEVLRSRYPAPPTPTAATGRAILDRRVVHIPDYQSDPDFPPSELTRALGLRTHISVPLWREGQVIGVINVGRGEVRPFTAKEIALLQTFADQAVIAIQNVRLFTELDARNRDLTEALEQQTATGEILRVISRSPTDVQPVFDAIAQSAVNLCDALFSTVFRYDGVLVHHAADNYPTAEMRAILTRDYPSPPDRNSPTTKAIREGRIVHVEDVLHDTTPAASREKAIALGYRTLLCVPMLRDGVPIGTINVARREQRPFTDKQIGLIRTFADQAVIAIENVRLFTELQAKNRDLTKALDRQTATAEILRVISSSPADVHPVFAAIAQSAKSLLGGFSGTVTRLIDDALQLGALTSTSPAGDQAARAMFPLSVTRSSIHGDAVRTRAPFFVTDVETDPRWSPEMRDMARGRGWRSFLAVPMLREDEVLGTIGVGRREPGPFTDDEVALLQTFADQAVIAIENARLLTELQARTQELTRSVEQLTALGEVGQAVTSTLDLETVLTTIVARAVPLAGVDGGSIYEYDEATEEFSLRVTQNVDEELVTLQRAVRVRKGEGAMGRMAVTREPVQIPDIAIEGAYESRVRDLLLRAGTRALLAVPLLREGRILGSLVVSRRAPGEFAADVVELLKTFATQSSLAIQNARLYQQLGVASRHKSEFLANMSHELRTPLNAIIGYSEMLEEEANDLGQAAFIADLRKINSAGKHLLELINAVLDLSKIEAGRMELYLEDFDVAGLVNDIAAVIQPLAEKNANRLQVTCAGNVGTMRADLTKVRQSLFNLLSNACKFTETGTVSLAAGRESDGADDWIVITVRDTGIGMSPDQIERLFQEFTQADAATGRKYGGTGLGLALSRRLCRMMGGDIAVTSEAGRGSTFTIRLPAVVTAPRPAAGSAPDE